MRFLISALLVQLAQADEISFNQDIRPILSSKCIQCHGPDDGQTPDGKDARKAGLRLDIEDGQDWEEVISRIHDKEDPMPPNNGHAKPLKPKERELLTKWIKSGAKYEDYWAFVSAKKQVLPEVKKTTWSKAPIDRFTLAKMEAKGKEPKTKADKRTLIRRLSLDLTGLPPTREEIQTYLADTSTEAYQNLVNRLIAKPQYGEHMAKFWLDLVRAADTNGMHHDHFRDHSPYRDWVIEAFNKNLSYDKFTKYQIAGDLYENPSNEQLIASGFNRLHLIIDVGTALPEESQFKNVVDRVSSVGTAFMGLTMQCAVCHDHKYDPITQKDFFQMYAFFDNFDGKPETGDRGTTNFYRGLQEPFINLPTEEQKAKLSEFANKLKETKEQIASLHSEKKVLQANLTKLEAAPVTPPAERAPAEAIEPPSPDHLKAKIATLDGSIKKLQGEIKTIKTREGKFLHNVRGAMVMRERKEVNQANIRIRGSYDAIGKEVFRDTPHFLPPLQKKGKDATRMDLAEWLVDPKNPLTARVAVNRFWQQFFGTGLVKTSEDFGAQGQWPSHPKLLDHLTLQFMESGWDVKAFVKSIVMTETYQQSSVGNSVDYQNDPENRLLARGSRTRLDSEVIRDQLLAVTGHLNLKMGGRSVKPPQPDGLWKMVALPTSFPNKFTPSKGDERFRRSIYSFWKRGLAPPQMTIFDAPARDACIARRERTNTPLQALLMMNEENYFNAAKAKAKELLSEKGSEKGKLTEVYETITAQIPSPETLATLKEGLASFRQDGDELHAWTMTVHTLLNLDSFKNKE